jgi:thimet oligopeptidase
MLRTLIVLALSAAVIAGCGPKPQGPKPLDGSPAGTQPLATPDAAAIGMPLTDTVEQYSAACNAALADARARLLALETFEGSRTIDGVLVPLNELSRVVSNTWNEAGIIEIAHPDAAFRDAAGACNRDYAKLGSEISLSRALFERVAAVDTSKADTATQFSQFKLVRDFKRAGVDKDEATRRRIAKLVAEINQAGQNFDRIIREDVREITLESEADLAGLPDDFIASHPPGADGTILITTDAADYSPFMAYADSDSARKALRIAQRSRGYPENTAYLKTLLAKRHELASLLGYSSFAAYITEDKMVQSPERVQRFIDEVAQIAAAPVATEKALLLERLRKTDPAATQVESWQFAYLAEQERRERFALDSRAVRAYLAFANVQQGIFDLAERLFGITIKEWDAAVWAPGVTAHEIWQDGKAIGRFYLDLHPRDGKAAQSAHYPIWAGVEGKQLPLSVLFDNLPGEGDPYALIEHAELARFLHEFGHLLHHQFAGHGVWVNNSGIATEWDFVEAPALLLEQFAYDYATLRTFAVNAQGKTIPEELVRQLNRARRFGEGIDTATQTHYAALSLAYHDRDPTHIDLDAELVEIENKYAPFPYLPGTHFNANFAHLNGYSATYYTYQWSLAIARDLFTRFAIESPANPAVSIAYRKAILDPGGSAPATELVEAFLGRPFTVGATSDWLARPQ